MSDLISRQALLNELENENSPYETIVNIEDTDTTQDIIEKTLKAYRKILRDMILEQPTAYDVDKVVEKLENLETMNNEKTHCKFSEGYACAIDHAIEIVKGGSQG